MPRNFKSRFVFTGSNQTAQSVGGVEKSLQRASGAVVQFRNALVAAGVGRLFTQAVGGAAAFEVKIGELSAITGATGQQLQTLSDTAFNLGRTTTTAGTQVAEAFKLVGSAKPDLLESTEALSAVTQEVITLSEASGLQLPEAAAAVGSALNQFGAGADQAARFVNALAAGSKFGAAEIPALAAGLKVAGVAARGAGVSFEGTVAAIELLAARGISGAEAGTALRNILIKLESQTNDQLKPSVVGVVEALRNLEGQNLSTADTVKLFGSENLVAADILADNASELESLTAAVTGTNTAYDQAATRTNNLTSDLTILRNNLQALQVTVFQNNESIRAMVQVVTLGVFQMTEMSKGTEQSAEAMAGLRSAVSFVTQVLFNMKEIVELVIDVVVQLGKAIAAVFELDLAKAEEALKGIGTEVNEFGEDVIEFARKMQAMERRLNDGATAAEIMRDRLKETGQAAAEVAESLPPALGGTADPASTGGAEATSAREQEAAERQRARLAERLQNLTASLDGEIEVERLAAERKQALLAEAFDAELLSRQEFNARRLQIEEEFQAARTEIEMRNADLRTRFEMMTAKNRTKFVLGSLVELTAGVAQQNKAMFRINQIASIGQAVINTAEAVTEMLTLPFPLNFAMAAVASAAGIAQIAAIKSAKFGGGTTPSVSATPTVNSVPVTNTGGSLPPSSSEFGSSSSGPRNIRIDLVGAENLSPEEVIRKTIDGIQEALDDGVRLEISGTPA